MSLEKAREFAKLVLESPELQARGNEVKAANYGEMAEKIAKIAKEEGFDCTSDEILRAAMELMGDSAQGELSDDDLESVAGGKAGMVRPEDENGHFTDPITKVGRTEDDKHRKHG